MAKKSSIKGSTDTHIEERPLDPSRNASDLMGDPSGMTGWTTGSGQETSAEPTEEQPSPENLPGGIIKSSTTHTPTGISKEVISDKAYNKSIPRQMSTVAGRVSDERANEAEQFTSVTDMIRSTHNDTIVTDTQTLSNNPENAGEQSISGSTPDSSSDDDMLAEAKKVGTQLDETEEDPKELGIGEDIDKAEEEEQTH